MRIEETFTLTGGRDEVFALLTDVPSVAGCVPGVDKLTQAEDGSWTAELSARLGPIKATFAGQVELTPTPPDHLEATGQGKDRRTASQVAVTFTADLVDQGPTATRVDAVADVTIRGRLGQFGTGVIRATATELIRDFVACADQALQHQSLQHQAPQHRATSHDHAPAGPPATQGRATEARATEPASSPTRTSPAQQPSPTRPQDSLATAKLVGRIALRTLAQAASWVVARVRELVLARKDRR